MIHDKGNHLGKCIYNKYFIRKLPLSSYYIHPLRYLSITEADIDIFRK